MTRQHKTSATSAGPHAGQDSIRQAYDAMGPQAFYSMHGERYTNPHEGQIYRALAALLDATPAAVWLGRLAMDGPAAAAGGSSPHGDDQQYDSSDDEDEDEQDEHGSSATCADDHPGRRGHRGSSNTPAAAAPAAAVAATPASHTTTRGPDPQPEPPVSQAVWRHVTRGVAAPVPLRVLDLACGSGEVTLSLEAWNAQRSVTPAEAATAAAAAAAAAATAAGAASSAAAPSGRTPEPQSNTCAQTANRGNQPKGKGKQQQQQQLVPPYKLYITACDPYTGQAYLARTGRAAQPWSFEDVAAGCLEGHVATDPGSSTQAASAPGQRSKHQAKQQQQQQQQQQQEGGNGTLEHHVESGAANDPRVAFELVVCSFALHLCEPSRLFATLHALSLSARWLLVLAPHKRPVVLPQHGWTRVTATKTDRTHLRLYRSLNVAEAGTGTGTGG